MRTIIYKSQFKRDYKKLKSSGLKIEKLANVIAMLQKGTLLPESCRDHPLKGELDGYRDCHIQGDWLLIYRITATELILVRTGSHGELFR